MRTLLVALLASVALPCAGAEITIKGNKVFLLGTIELNDDKQLRKPLNPTPSLCW